MFALKIKGASVFNLLFINQVREQAKASAASIRNDVRKEKERLLNKFANEVEVNQSCFFFSFNMHPKFC